MRADFRGRLFESAELKGTPSNVGQSEKPGGNGRAKEQRSLSSPTNSGFRSHYAITVTFRGNSFHVGSKQAHSMPK